jgi:hypothetical protein
MGTTGFVLPEWTVDRVRENEAELTARLTS